MDNAEKVKITRLFDMLFSSCLNYDEHVIQGLK